MRNEASRLSDTGEAETHFQGTDLPAEFRYKSGISTKLVFERVNAVTWKLTNGEQTNVPVRHGHWAGYRTSKTVASVIEVVPGKWLARCGDRACGPSSLRKAKANALALAKGATGEHEINNPIAHLNWLTARLLDRQSVQRIPVAASERTKLEADNALRDARDALFGGEVLAKAGKVDA